MHLIKRGLCVYIQELSDQFVSHFLPLRPQSALQSFGRPGGKQLAIHSSSVLTSLQSRLARVSTAFKTVLERRSESLKAQARRRGHYLDSGSAPDNASLEAELGSATVPAPPLMPTSTVMPSILLQVGHFHPNPS
ncbi:unnamed protein product [Protopolystoma xenopodis]|uniref:Uncharacterized protein n=1 Tax=Protopolystoma xenopodis TaxID=117903 RepID=A0A448WLE8_9PLAT|nr:unnamed protein product [Protopolystoma xenopodis]